MVWHVMVLVDLQCPEVCMLTVRFSTVFYNQLSGRNVPRWEYKSPLAPNGF